MTEITPETLKNATPDNLKKLARLIRMGQPLQSVAASEAIDLCVAVWATDRERLEQWEAEAQDKARPQVRPMTVLENAYMDIEGKLGQAEARIEVLGKVLRQAEGSLRLAMVTMPESAQRDVLVEDWLAVGDVLGAKEKP